MDKQQEAAHVIESLGGPSAVARICGITQPSVSGWKVHGIPKGWKQFLRLGNPQAFKQVRAKKTG